MTSSSIAVAEVKRRKCKPEYSFAFCSKLNKNRMGVGLMEIGVKTRKVVTFTITMCYRSVCRHPFLVGMMFFLIFLYRSFPSLFSVLVSASPVLFSTAVLLGTLLSFGQPNIPELEKVEKTTHEIVSLKTGVSRDDIVAEGHGSYSVERYPVERSDAAEKFIEEETLSVNDVSEVDKDERSSDVERMGEKTREFHFENQVIGEIDTELRDMGFEEKNELVEEKLDEDAVIERQYSKVQMGDQLNLELDDDRSQEDPFESQKVDHLDSLPGSPWKRVGDGEYEDDEMPDSGSDRAESSSPDASMADIIPMLDELHPLLDEDVPQPAHVSHDGSDAGSEHSPKSSDGSNESDVDTENHEELEVGEDEEEEEILGDKEDEIKSAITWTEDDQKNLMDLGTSELERNQRLENLIARRRARKNMRLMAEKNLIDLESADLPFNVAPISTSRNNPFDLPYDPNDYMGLPPIPGSAPSILLPRRNPFDLPYDSSEEKPDLMEDNFQQDFVTFQPKEPFFRRHESFNVGPSIFGASRHEKHDIKLRPYFVPERLASEGISYPSFLRQSSELSDSKVSSVPETESIGSAGDLEDKKLVEEDFSQETEVFFNSEHVPELVGHGSQSSDDAGSVEFGQVECRDVELDEVELTLGDGEAHQEMESSLSESGSVANPVDPNANEIHLNAEAAEQRYSSRSSSPLSPEVTEKLFSEKERAGLPTLEPKRSDLIIEESSLSMQPSTERSDSKTASGLIDENPQKEPVYDSSPPAVKKNLTSSSISYDLQTTSFAEKEAEANNQSIEKGTSGSVEILVDSSELQSAHENELRATVVTEVSEQEVKTCGILEFDQDSYGANASLMPDHVDTRPSSRDLEEELLHQDESFQHMHSQLASSSFDADIRVAGDRGIDEVESSASIVETKSNKDQKLAIPDGEHNPLMVEHISLSHPDSSSFVIESQKEIALSFEQDEVHPDKEGNSSTVQQNSLTHLHPSSLETGSVEEHIMDKEIVLESEQNQLQSSSFDGTSRVGICQEEDQKLIATDYQRTSEDYHVSQPENDLSLPDKPMVEFCSENHVEMQEPFTIEAQLIDKESTDYHVDMQNNVEEVDEIKEIDEGLLLELDAVNDYGINDLGSNLNEIDKHQLTRGETTEVCETDVGMGMENIRMSKVDEMICKEQEIEGGSELQLSGTSSFEHVDPSITGVVHGDVKNPVALSVEQPSQITEVEPADSSLQQNRNAEVNQPGMPVVAKQVNRDAESSSELCEPMSDEIDFGMPVLEARLVEDISLVFKHINENEMEKPIVVESIHDESISEEFVAVGSDTENNFLPVTEARLVGATGEGLDVVESQNPAEFTLEVHGEETRYPEHTSVISDQVSDGNLEKLLKSEQGAADAEAKEVGLPEDLKSSPNEFDALDSNTVAEKPDNEVETLEISLSTSEVKGKTKKSHKSSSSSISSSSSSDSDRE